MSTKLFKYNDLTAFDKKTGKEKKRIVHNGDTTVVYGKTTIEFWTHDEALAFKNALDALYDLGGCDAILTKGVSKRHEGDAYDEKIGETAASMKAERTGNRLAKAKLGATIASLEALLALLKEADDELDHRSDCLTKDIQNLGAK